MPKENNNIPTGLYWQGKRTEVERISLPFQTIETINESRATREKEKDSLLRGLGKKENPTWHNRLIWGDNKHVMSSLLEEFAGKIDLIYIDPPFFTGTDQSIVISAGENIPITKEQSLIEEYAYRNVWKDGAASYFQWVYDRLTLMADLLSTKGMIFIRHDQYWSHYVKVVADEVFGKSNFQNEIVVKRIFKNVTQQGKLSIPLATDSLFVYFKTDEAHYVDIHEKLPQIRESYWRAIDDSSGLRNPPERIILGKKYYPPAGKHFKFSQDKIDIMTEEGRIRINSTTGRPQYLVEEADKGVLNSNWTDISGYSFTTGYPTENSEMLLERVIKVGSRENGLVADFFCGSGTTGAVTEKLGRRWIMADIGRYAIHTTRKRLLGIEGCRPFVVQNLGKYERQYWQGVTFSSEAQKSSSAEVSKPIYEYLKFILELYHAEPITGCLWIHGKKSKSLVHVGAVDAPVTLSDIEFAIDECRKMKQTSLDILGWEWEMGLHDVVQDVAKTKGVNLSLKYIPREVMDPRAVEAGDITFYELAYLEVDVSKNKHGEFEVALKDFVIPNHDLIPEEVRSKIKKWSDYIDYWSIDWDYNNDTFHNMWQSYRTRKDRTLLLKSDPHLYEKKSKHLIMIKVIDIFGNDTTRLVEVTV
jgi:DNA modification methylase